MKKLLFILMVVLLAACSQTRIKYGEGGVNACQYVKERMTDLHDNMQSVEVISEDTLLYGTLVSSARLALSEQSLSYLKGKISKEKFEEDIKKSENIGNDILYSWKFGEIVNDSLHKEYSYDWRKVYTIKVTMKSGVEKELRVLMDNDGQTPHMMESDVAKELSDFKDEIHKAIDYLYDY